MLDLKLADMKFSFPTQSLTAWFQRLHSEIRKYPTAYDNAIDIISQYYTELIDYLVNPKLAEKNLIVIYRAFLETNIFDKLCQKHEGLFQ